MQKQPDYINAKRYQGRKPGYLFLLLFLCALTAACCFFLYQHDNKYTAPGPSGAYGQMNIDTGTLEGQRLVWLTCGWEFYGGTLLTPGELHSGSQAPDRYVFTGQLGGFESIDGQPFGSASYRLTVTLPQEPQTYALYLPEIYSSCRLYINGSLYLTLGETSPDGYIAETAEKIVSFPTSGETELLLAVSNYSNTYSGLVYPPALGLPDAIHDMVSLRLSLRTAWLTMTLLTGIISLLVGAANRKSPLPFLYALFCLLFLGYTCYPVVKTLFPHLGGLYLIEQLSFTGMILLVFLLQRTLFSLNSLTNTFGITFGGIVCIVCIIYHLFLPQAGLRVMLAYSALIELYKWLGAALLTVDTLRVLRQRSLEAPHVGLLLCGMVVFDCTLVMDRLLPLYEPIYSGWFLELSSLCLVLLTGAVILKDIYSHTATSLVLEESIRLTQQNLAMQREQHQIMMETLSNERTFRHDLRQHISVLHEFANADDIESLKGYFYALEGRLPAHDAKVFCENAAADAILRHYEAQAARSDVEFLASVQVASDMPVSDVDLCVIFGNCLENALEACLRQQAGKKYIKVNAGITIGVFAITIENSFDGTLRRSAGGLLSSKRPQAGIGTASVTAIAKKYNGRATFEAEGQVLRASVVLHV